MDPQRRPVCPRGRWHRSASWCGVGMVAPQAPSRHSARCHHQRGGKHVCGTGCTLDRTLSHRSQKKTSVGPTSCPRPSATHLAGPDLCSLGLHRFQKIANIQKNPKIASGWSDQIETCFFCRGGQDAVGVQVALQTGTYIHVAQGHAYRHMYVKMSCRHVYRHSIDKMCQCTYL